MARKRHKKEPQQSPAWRETLQKAEMVARTDSTVLITGESGSGKRFVAREIHRICSRNERPFVEMDSAATEPERLGAEFAAAVERAGEGTVFLREVGLLPPDVQGRLFRMLEEGRDVRILASTNRNLADECLARNFRDDLYFRLNVFPIAVPPLRERREDIEPLLRAFLERHARRADKTFGEVDRAAID
ncbi:MAG: sigma 54-interacting transcriptional regulator, partial [Planctomycetota bacterium]